MTSRPGPAENLDVLADELGLVLKLVSTEVPVGSFFLDIRAETKDERPVIIENQLARTDHGHPGQLIVYASGLEASIVIWVAPEFRDEHRRALDRLNERTDTGVDFFGVQVSVVEIGMGGPRAPVFDADKALEHGSSLNCPARCRPPSPGTSSLPRSRADVAPCVAGRCGAGGCRASGL